MPLGEVLNLTSFSDAMKVRGLFEKQFDQFRTTSFLLDNFRRRAGKVKLGGRTMEIPLKTRDMASGNFIDEMEFIAEADMPGYEIATVGIKTFTSRFQISHQAHLSSKVDRAAWVGAQMAAMSSTVEASGQILSRALEGYGTAALARVMSFVAGPPIVITLHPDMTAASARTHGKKYIERGMRLSASATLTGKLAEKTFDARVIAKGGTEAAPTITVDGVLGDLFGDAVTGDFLFLGSKERTSKNRAPMGVMGYIDDGTLVPVVLGIDRTAAGNDYWRGEVNISVGGADIENEIQSQVDAVDVSVGGRTDLIRMAMGVWRRFAADLRGDRRFVTAAETGKYRGGTKFLMYSGAEGSDIPITRDRDVPTGVMEGFDFRTWYLGTLMEAQWFKHETEAGIFRWVEDQLAWQAIYAWMGELICVKPAANWISYDLNEI